MTTQDLTLIKAAIEKMRYHESRQKVLSQNIANANTPGYQPMDVDPVDFNALLKQSSSSISLSAATTDPKHLHLGSASGSGSQGIGKKEKTKNTSPSGNAVVLEEQLLKMNENYTDHRLTTTIYQKNIDMLKNALRSQ